MNSVEAKFLETYAGMKSAYGFQANLHTATINDKGKYDKKCLKSNDPYNEEAIRKHLSGKEKIGPYLLVENKTKGVRDHTRFGVIDVDDYKNPELFKELKAIIDQSGVPFVLYRSSSNAGHMYLHFNKLERAKDVIDYLSSFRDKYLHKYEDIEIFPKQNEVKNTDYGNFIFAPYFSGDQSLQVAYDDDLKAIKSVAEHLKFVDTKRTDLIEWQYSTIDNVIETKINEQKPINTGAGTWIEILSEGPPCLQKLKQDQSQDYRNETMYQYAVMLKKAKGEADIIELNKINETLFKDPLKSNDIKTIAGSHSKKDYDFRCKVDPFRSVCNKGLCHINRFGKGLGKDVANVMRNYVLVRDHSKVVRLRPNNATMSIEGAIASMKSECGLAYKEEKQGKSDIRTHFLETASQLNAVDTFEWFPNKPETYEREGPYGNIKVVNTFKPTSISPIASNDISPFMDFIDIMFGQAEEMLMIKEIFLNWLAHIHQKPDEKTDLAIVMKTRVQGSGKSMIEELMEETLGDDNVSLIDMSDLDKGWADPIINKLFVGVEELYEMGAGQRKKIKANIKKIITQRTMTGNMKGKAYQKNVLFSRMYFMSNENSPLAIEKLDRRFLVIEPVNQTTELLAKTKELGTALKKWCEEDQGYGKILHYLLNKDISKFNPRMRAPETKAKDDMVYAGMSDWHKELAMAYEEKEAPFPEGLHLFDPKAIADLYGMDISWATNFFKDHFGFHKVATIQKCTYYIPKEIKRLSGYNEFQADNYPINVQPIRTHLWTDDFKIKEDYQYGKLKNNQLIRMFAKPIKLDFKQAGLSDKLSWALHKNNWQEFGINGQPIGEAHMPDWLKEIYNLNIGNKDE